MRDGGIEIRKNWGRYRLAGLQKPLQKRGWAWALWSRHGAGGLVPQRCNVQGSKRRQERTVRKSHVGTGGPNLLWCRVEQGRLMTAGRVGGSSREHDRSFFVDAQNHRVMMIINRRTAAAFTGCQAATPPTWRRIQGIE